MTDRRLRVNVAVDVTAGPLADALPALAACGFEIDTVLDVLGIVTGTVGPSEVPRLREQPHVIAVEESGELGLY